MSDSLDKEKIELAKKIYDDGGKAVVEPAGELVGLLPRAIKAALAPIEKWILYREYSVKETEKMLEKKLENISPDMIETPEPHIAVPALQYISYCMDNEELRDMYANLLANSMNKIVKNGVHPAFVEIIKQLCPDEAKILKYFFAVNIVPTITLYKSSETGGTIKTIVNFSNVGEITKCENPYDINKYFDNLIRLGLIEPAKALTSLFNKGFYDELKNHPLIEQQENEIRKLKDGHNKPEITESYMSITDFGKDFCRICLL